MLKSKRQKRNFNTALKRRCLLAVTFLIMALNLAIFATDAVATTTENLLNNPGGESDTDGWDNVEGTLKSYSSVGDGDNKVTSKSGTRLLAFNEDINKAKASQTVDVSPYKGAFTNAK